MPAGKGMYMCIIAVLMMGLLAGCGAAAPAPSTQNTTAAAQLETAPEQTKAEPQATQETTPEPTETAEEEPPEPAPPEVGQYVVFGSYEQDNDLSNGPEPIEWQVLEVKDGSVFLVSRYGLDSKPFCTRENLIAAWETCSLRTWLNDDFLNTAFTGLEQYEIQLTDVDNSSAQGYFGWKAEEGNTTRDKVFLLSCAEVNHYFGALSYGTAGSDRIPESRLAATAYAKAQGAYVHDGCKTADGQPSSAWWLRSPHNHEIHYRANVTIFGSLDLTYAYSDLCIRPAIWVNVNALRDK